MECELLRERQHEQSREGAAGRYGGAADARHREPSTVVCDRSGRKQPAGLAARARTAVESLQECGELLQGLLRAYFIVFGPDARR
jgi:hypothetical protein